MTSPVIVRAWPDHPPPNRAHVIDDLPRVTVDRYDYSTLLSLKADVISLDWDIAVDRDDLVTFRQRALAAPEWPRVAPYKLHHKGGQWAIFDHTWTPLPEGMMTCCYFGFGMVYLPYRLLRECHTSREVDDTPLTDCVFSMWFFKRHQRRTPVDWGLHPVHLHA